MKINKIILLSAGFLIMQVPALVAGDLGTLKKSFSNSLASAMAGDKDALYQAKEELDEIEKLRSRNPRTANASFGINVGWIHEQKAKLATATAAIKAAPAGGAGAGAGGKKPSTGPGGGGGKDKVSDEKVEKADPDKAKIARLIELSDKIRSLTGTDDVTLNSLTDMLREYEKVLNTLSKENKALPAYKEAQQFVVDNKTYIDNNRALNKAAKKKAADNAAAAAKSKGGGVAGKTTASTGPAPTAAELAAAIKAADPSQRGPAKFLKAAVKLSEKSKMKSITENTPLLTSALQTIMAADPKTAADAGATPEFIAAANLILNDVKQPPVTGPKAAPAAAAVPPFDQAKVDAIDDAYADAYKVVGSLALTTTKLDNTNILKARQDLKDAQGLMDAFDAAYTAASLADLAASGTKNGDINELNDLFAKTKKAINDHKPARPARPSAAAAPASPAPAPAPIDINKEAEKAVSLFNAGGTNNLDLAAKIVDSIASGSDLDEDWLKWVVGFRAKIAAKRKAAVAPAPAAAGAAAVDYDYQAAGDNLAAIGDEFDAKSQTSEQIKDILKRYQGQLTEIKDAIAGNRTGKGRASLQSNMPNFDKMVTMMQTAIDKK